MTLEMTLEEMVNNLQNTIDKPITDWLGKEDKPTEEELINEAQRLVANDTN